jgi:hypothetical protein
MATSRRPDMKLENDRRRSFSSWPYNAPVSKDKLASDGFYYLGHKLETACAFCKVEISDWHYGETPIKRHLPQCEFPKLKSLREQMKQREKRQQTFTEWNTASERLVNAGFFLNDESIPQCAWCRGTLLLPLSNENPFEEHARKYPCCEFILNPPPYACHGMDELNTSSSSNVINHAEPKYPNMIIQEQRIKTFPKWSDMKKIQDITNAGFFYIGREDATMCFHCGGSLHNWEDGDHPWIEHAKWYPHCYFVILSKGLEFIDECKQKCNDPIVIAKYIASDSQHTNVCSAHSCAFMRTNNMCKICMSQESRITFIPCGHFVTCAACASSIKECVICRKRITSTIRTFT